MAACENFQSQLLDHLYDLLDTDESWALQEHLKHCATCQAALTHAQDQRRLLGVAAKTGFPEVRFAAPAAGVIVSARAEEDRKVQQAISWQRWTVWAVAAVLLVAVAGFGVPAGSWALKQRGLHERAEAAKAEYAEARAAAVRFDREQEEKRSALAETQRQLAAEAQKLHDTHARRAQELGKALNEQRLRVAVSGPAALQPGAPNNYQVSIQDWNGRPARAKLTASVRDQARRELFTLKETDAQGTYTLKLPPSLELRPDAQLALEISARRPDGPASQLRAELPLAAPLFVTHLTTDKPMYQPGETVRFRSLTLERFSLRPPQENFQLHYTVTSPMGAVIHQQQGVTLLADASKSEPTLTVGPDQKTVRGVGAGEWAIDPGLPGGEYTLTVKELTGRFPDQQRKFMVNKYQKDRLLKELDFNRKSYGPGDEVQAACKVKRAEGGATIINQQVRVTVNVDGKTYGPDGKESGNPTLLRTDSQGTVTVRFTLPPAIERGLATLSVVFTDGASTETLARPIPIVLKKLNVEFFPEGGDLVAGAPNRVYFQVRSTLDKPADLTGKIVDDEGKVVADDVRTLNDDKEPGVNQGMGAFTFTPKAGRKYELKIETPKGMEGRYTLPDVFAGGVVLQTVSGVVKSGESLKATVHSPDEARELLVGAYCRGRLIEHTTIKTNKDVPVPVEFALKNAPGGVYRVTVFEMRGPETLRPLAERLVYRMPAEQLSLSVKPTQDRYVPGDKVTLSMQATTENKTPAPAILMVAVVDKSVLTMADEKTHRSMPTHFFLTTEVRKPEDMEYADFLLSPHPKAAIALDLLLGTQGWRRFAEQDPAKFKQKHQSEADRLLVLNGQSPKPSGDLFQREQQRLQAEYLANVRRIEERQHAAQEALVALTQDHQQKRPELLTGQHEAYSHYQAAEGAANSHRGQIGRLKTIALWMLLPLLLAGAGIFLMLAIVRNLHRAVPYYAVSAVCMLCVLVGIAFLQWANPDDGKTSQVATGASSSTVPPPPGTEQATAPDVAGGPANVMPWEARPRMAPTDDLSGAKPGGAGFAGGRGTAFPPPQPAAPAGRPGPTGPAGAAKKLDEMQFRMMQEKGAAPMMLRDGREGDRAKVGNRMLEERKNAADPQAEAERMFRRAPGREPMMDRADALRLQPGGKGEAEGGEQMARRRAAFGGRGPGGGFGDAKDKDQEALDHLPPLFVREYAHRRQSSATPDVRRDFTETLYWHPVLVLPDGNGQVTFDLCDSVTTFQVAAVGHTLDGRLGSVTTLVESRKPFTLEPRIPLEVTADDKIDIPVSVANNTTGERTAVVRIHADGLNLLKGQKTDELPLGADQRRRLVYRFQPSLVEGQANVFVEGALSGFEGDKVLQSLRVVPQGFPVIRSHSDMLEKVAENALELPKDWLMGTLKARVEVYPSTLADLQKGLAALLREPHGCFEQTSTSNYPNLLILDYLKETDQALPEIEKRARELLGRGYQKLTSFECPYDSAGRNGFEWFGARNAAHEALTAYGLMQFRDMSRVQEVDQAMVERTKQWLLAQKDGKGGFKRNARALDTFGRAPEDITNAYIIWALTESSKDDDVTKELEGLHTKAKESKDPYFLSLVANSLINRNRTDDAVALLKKVVEAQKPEGYLVAGSTSITGSGGRDLQIETTALAVLGWLKANRPNDFNKPVQSAVKWIGQQRGGRGGFGSTQSTILALKALIAFAKANKKTPEGGELTLFVGDQKVGNLKFAANVSEALTIELPEAEKHLKPGKNAVRVEITGKNVFPYTLSWSYQTLQPLSAAQAPVKLETSLAKTSLNEGDTVRLTAKVRNVSGKGQSMAVAILGLPAGLAIPEDMKQLKDYIRVPTDGSRPLVSAFEIQGRELVLYWRDLAPDQKIEVPIDLICRVPGEYSGPASRAYLYYNADHKHWVEPLKVAITAKSE